ncbi:chorismate mutase [Spongiactinospora rosea]|uniref:chorismate mutase n=1 Tax=Spongiactinospora rosea TaxID=2248750 RepID=A0A366LE92_9ACTN|nr:chorismate mutase [Spongiactinospora rosea]RBQ12187.1 chorismate mutase [Spongiactinospora rosea]
MNSSAPAVRAIRGAIQVAADDAGEIRVATKELITAVLQQNDVTLDDLISIFFTVTPDLVSEFPALAAYEFGLADVPMLCAVEMSVSDVMPRVIRLMAHVTTSRARAEIRHPYLRGASAITPARVFAERKSRAIFPGISK